MAVTVLDLFRPHMYVVQFNNLHYELRERERERGCVCGGAPKTVQLIKLLIQDYFDTMKV